MTVTGPSAILTAAADLIRDTAAASDFNGDMADWVYWNTDRTAAAASRRWIALLSPAMAPTLETLLRVAAVEEEHPTPLEYGSATISGFMTVLRELARQIVEARDGCGATA